MPIFALLRIRCNAEVRHPNVKQGFKQNFLAPPIRQPRQTVGGSLLQIRMYQE